MKACFVLKAIDGAPGEFQLLPYGEIDLEGDDPAFVDEEAMALIIEDFKRRGKDMVIDYEHQTLSGAVAPAAGWIKDFIDKGKAGLFAVVEWTAKAREMLTGKEYRFFSPVMWLRKKDRKVIAVDNVALTNDPKINNLTPIVAKLSRDQAKETQKARSKKYKIGIKEGGHVTKPGEWESVPDDEFLDPVNYRYPCPDADQTRAAAGYWGRPKNQAQYTPEERSIISERLDKFKKKFKIGEYREGAKMFDKLKKLFGLADDAGEDQVIEAAETVVAKNKELEGNTEAVACKEVLDALGADPKNSKEQVVAKVNDLRNTQGKKDSLETELQVLKKDHEDLKKKWDLRERDDRVKAALKAGKITPAQKGWAEEYALKDPAGFEVFVAKAAVVVPLEDLPAEDGAVAGGSASEKIQKLVAKKMKEDKNLTYGEAMNLVAGENPKLAEEYIQTGRDKS